MPAARALSSALPLRKSPAATSRGQGRAKASVAHTRSITVVRLERRACLLVTKRLEIAERGSVTLPFDLRANLRHLTFCGSIHALKDAALISESQGLLSTCNSPQ